MKPVDFEVILWDFDGVIINSNPIREAGFRNVLSQYPNDQVDLLIAYHNANGGLSRYIKFRYFFEEIRNELVTDSQIDYLATQFSKIMRKFLVNRDLLILPIINFIMEQYNLKKKMHIVSGSDGNELRELCKNLNIEHFFLSINGSPTPKSVLVKKIIDESAFNTTDFCLIGDSINDFDAAQDNSIAFFGFNNMSLKYLDYYFEI